MNRTNWLVGDYSVRPAGKPDECFYCHEKLGEQHRIGCVIRDRTVVIDVTVRMVVAVPEDWDEHLIEFTEGSSCSNNIIAGLTELAERLRNSNMCTCGMVTKEFVREADSMDEKESQMFVDMRPS